MAPRYEDVERQYASLPRYARPHVHRGSSSLHTHCAAWYYFKLIISPGASALRDPPLILGKLPDLFPRDAETDRGAN